MAGNLVFKKQNGQRKYNGSFVASKMYSENSTRTKKWDRNMVAISKGMLLNLYLLENKSMKEVADCLECSFHKVAYWMAKYKIPVRSHSDATYVKRNPKGDPFVRRLVETKEEALLFGLGLGLYWGEGTKANKNSIRLGNSDPKLIRAFIKFLTRHYAVERSRLRFGLQVFSDTVPEVALRFWVRALKVSPIQFQKVIITPSRGTGTYRKKLANGVLTVQFHNKKLRDVLIAELETLKI